MTRRASRTTMVLSTLIVSMKELLRIVENPRRCSYLHSEFASLELRVVADMTAAEYGDLLARGYRRFGWQVFRPQCAACSECRSMRIVIPDFIPNSSERRVLRQNEDIRAELHPLFATREHVDLYNRYQRFMHEHRGWALQQVTLSEYRDTFISGAAHLGKQWLYFAGHKLVGIATMDEAPGAISLVYFIHDPAWRPQSPGRFSVLNQLLYAKQRGLCYAYLGYWIKACPSMNYKNRFHPHEILAQHPAEAANPVWKAAE